MATAEDDRMTMMMMMQLQGQQSSQEEEEEKTSTLKPPLQQQQKQPQRKQQRKHHHHQQQQQRKHHHHQQQQQQHHSHSHYFNDGTDHVEGSNNGSGHFDYRYSNKQRPTAAAGSSSRQQQQQRDHLPETAAGGGWGGTETAKGRNPATRTAATTNNPPTVRLPNTNSDNNDNDNGGEPKDNSRQRRTRTTTTRRSINNSAHSAHSSGGGGGGGGSEESNDGQTNSSDKYVSKSSASSRHSRKVPTLYLYILGATMIVTLTWAVTMTIMYAQQQTSLQNQQDSVASSSSSSSSSFGGSGSTSSVGNVDDPESRGRRTLRILHSSDGESSFQDVNTLEEKINHYSALVDVMRRTTTPESSVPVPSLHLAAGDMTLNGPFFLASEQIQGFDAPGVGDMEMMNAMNLEANCVGNHEFDSGIDGFATYLQAAKFPMLAVNLDFSNVQLRTETPNIEIGTDGIPCKSSPGQVVKSCYVDLSQDGIGLVGIIGVAPDDMFNIVNDPDVPGLDFVGGRDPITKLPLVPYTTLVKEQVDMFENELGIDIIILIDHSNDYSTNLEAATQFVGIDIILSGRGGGLWAGQKMGPYNMLREEDEATHHYPQIAEDAVGLPIIVIKADEQYRYLGNLLVTFDGNGIVESYDGRSGVLATTEDTMDLLSYTLGGADVEPMPDVVDIFRRYRRTNKIQESFELVGRTEYYLEGNRNEVRTRETNLGRLAADVYLWAGNKYASENGLPPVDIALVNSGGIRAPIAGPSIIRITIQAAFAFDGKLSIIELSAGQLISAMENAVSRSPSSDGRFPQIAGMAIEVDLSKPAIEGSTENVFQDRPSRIKSLVVTTTTTTTTTNSGGGQNVTLMIDDTVVADYTAVGDLERTFVLATNDFLSIGGDAYFSFVEASVLLGGDGDGGDETTTTELGEQLLIEEYIIDELGSVVRIPDPPPEPPRIKILE